MLLQRLSDLRKSRNDLRLNRLRRIVQTASQREINDVELPELDELLTQLGITGEKMTRAVSAATRIGARTGLKQRWWKERSTDHHQRPDRERTSTHIILRAARLG